MLISPKQRNHRRGLRLPISAFAIWSWIYTRIHKEQHQKHDLNLKRIFHLLSHSQTVTNGVLFMGVKAALIHTVAMLPSYCVAAAAEVQQMPLYSINTAKTYTKTNGGVGFTGMDAYIRARTGLYPTPACVHRLCAEQNRAVAEHARCWLFNPTLPSNSRGHDGQVTDRAQTYHASTHAHARTCILLN